LIFVGAAKRGLSKSGFWQIHFVISCVGPEKPLRRKRCLEKPGISGEFLQG
jgi:hypothetical protein